MDAFSSLSIPQEFDESGVSLEARTDYNIRSPALWSAMAGKTTITEFEKRKDHKIKKKVTFG